MFPKSCGPWVTSTKVKLCIPHEIVPPAAPIRAAQLKPQSDAKASNCQLLDSLEGEEQGDEEQV